MYSEREFEQMSADPESPLARNLPSAVELLRRVYLANCRSYFVRFAVHSRSKRSL